MNFEALNLAPSKTLQFAYAELSQLTLTATAGAVEVSGVGGGGVVADNTRYELQHVKIHAPAEHTVRGERAGAELQFVHAFGAHTLVLSVLVSSTTSPTGTVPFSPPSEVDLDYQPFLAPLLGKELPADGATATAPNGTTWNVSALFDTLTGPSSFWQYDGSLTAPPCTAARWFVRREPMRASDAQIAQLHSAADGLSGGAGNYRYVAAWGDRKPVVWRSKPGSFVEDEPPRLRSGPHPRTDGELQAVGEAELARDLAHRAKEYADDVEARMQEGADLHLRKLQAERKAAEDKAIAQRKAQVAEKAEWMEPVVSQHFMPRVPDLAREAAEKVVARIHDVAIGSADTVTRHVQQEVRRQQSMPTTMPPFAPYQQLPTGR